MNKALLFPLSVQGKGTGDIESFSSYFMRLARLHSVTPVGLYNYLIQSFKKYGLESVYITPRKTLNFAPFITCSPYVRVVQDVIRELSGVNVMDTNFSMLQGQLRFKYQDVTSSLRWCPECWKEMLLRGDEPYSKLIWQVSSVTHCDKHKVKLQQKCPHCGKPQNMTYRGAGLENCANCGGSLCDFSDVQNVGLSWKIYGGDMAQFLGEYALDAKFKPSMDGFRKSVSHILFNNCNPKFEPAIKPSNAFYYEMLGFLKRKTTLLHARRIAYAYGISLHTLLTGRVGETSGQIRADLVGGYIPEGIKPVERNKNNHKEIRRRATRLCEELETPLTLNDFASRLDISVGYLEYQLPELCKRIRKQRLNYLKAKRSNLVNKAKSSALSYFTDKRYARFPQSRKQAYKVLREETSFPKFVLVRAIEEAYQAINP